jgi:uncharacterized protein with gpF-like domain
MILRATGTDPILLHPVRASAAEEAWYRRQLIRLIDEMCRVTQAELLATYKTHRAALGLDTPPPSSLNQLLKKQAKQWTKKFEAIAAPTSKSFADKATRHSQQGLHAELKKAGFAVKPQFTKSMEKGLKGIVKENVDLIKSIPKQHFAEVREQVLESVLKGRDLKGLTEKLIERHGVTKSRAQFIARDQNNKATALMNRIQQLDLGLKQARWQHTSASVTPRQEHIDFDGMVYNVDEGMWSEDVGDFVWPGSEPNCGCTDQIVVPGYDQ